MTELEKYFENFRKDIIGIDAEFLSPYGKQKVIYADWIASGRLYKPIENILTNVFGEMVGNTHSEASETGRTMTHCYKLAQKIIKNHVHANENDIIIATGSGMTGCINKLQRILGFKVPEQAKNFCLNTTGTAYCSQLPEEERPIVFLTHLEHHSNHTSWYETIADVKIIEPDENLMVKPEHLREELKKHSHRKMKIGSFSACSNVTGYFPPYYELAKVMHEFGGICLVDFAASAPYEKIDMHPTDENAYLDGIFLSPHKFLGGPGSTGIMVFNKKLYCNKIPDQPGGGTVNWTNRWGKYSYITDIESREDGGTPAFLQTIRAALCVKLKEKMNCEKIHLREQELLKIAFEELPKIKGMNILAENIQHRLGVISFYIKDIHHNLIVKILNDRFGIQVRGGCSCAGTYGHYLLSVSEILSKTITDKIDSGDLSLKPGWVRLSLHPTMRNQELFLVVNALREISENIESWKKDYQYCKETNEFYHKNFAEKTENHFAEWFNIEI